MLLAFRVSSNSTGLLFRSLADARAAASRCMACPLYARATQTVFGEGSHTAQIMLVGEQPGDQEDVKGRPFVGPAGRLLDEILGAAGIDRNDAYVTNAVKHFKWEPRGKRRLHSKPNSAEMAACRPWLRAEAQLVAPRTIVALGASAAHSIAGPHFRLMEDMGKDVATGWAPHFVATYHPSALLRMHDRVERQSAHRLMIEHLKHARRLAAADPSADEAAETVGRRGQSGGRP